MNKTKAISSDVSGLRGALNIERGPDRNERDARTGMGIPCLGSWISEFMQTPRYPFSTAVESWRIRWPSDRLSDQFSAQ